LKGRSGGAGPTGIDFEAEAARKKLGSIARVVLVGSGKGGVGKSFVSCGLALSLAQKGYRTAVLDIDIHGASVPGYLGVRPPVKSTAEGLEPKKVGRLKVMSLALFTGENPIPLRGEKKQSLITQLFASTNWGELDFLVVDLPPSTGDELLSAFALFEGKSALVLVTTPSKGATTVVSRLRRLAEVERVPVEGVVLNMAYLDAGKRRVLHPFGKPDREAVERGLESGVLVEIPLEPRLSSEGLVRLLREREGRVSIAFDRLVSSLAAPSKLKKERAH
jgi:ATP-binding protein involved in chromosome partitioning